MITDPIDHTADAQERVTYQYSEATRFLATIAAFSSRTQNIEDALLQVANIPDIDTAVGVNLDVIGDIVGIGRVVPDADPLPFFGFDDTPNGQAYGSERVNMVKWSDGLNNVTAWTAPNLLFEFSPPFTKLIETAINSTHHILQSRVGGNEVTTLHCVAKVGERTMLRLAMNNNGAYQAGAIFNIAAGTVFSTDAPNSEYTSISASMVSLGGGWWQCMLTTSKIGLSTDNRPIIGVVDGAGAFSYLGDGVSGIYVKNVQLDSGPDATAYILTTTAAVSVLDPTGYRFYEAGERAFQDWALLDTDYRTYIRARVIRNQARGTVDDIIATLATIFPNDQILVNEVPDDTMIYIGINRVATGSEAVILTFPALVPKPAGVRMAFRPYQTLINNFGFDPSGAVYGDTDFPTRGGPIAEETF